MPVMSCLELMERARELRPMKQFRSVDITGYGREADARDALSAGFDAHVSQPISIARLKSALDSLGL
jgi:two-component system CheB/CheR fusion protein